jgi:hypothetical protein
MVVLDSVVLFPVLGRAVLPQRMTAGRRSIEARLHRLTALPLGGRRAAWKAYRWTPPCGVAGRAGSRADEGRVDPGGSRGRTPGALAFVLAGLG